MGPSEVRNLKSRDHLRGGVGRRQAEKGLGNGVCIIKSDYVGNNIRTWISFPDVNGVTSVHRGNYSLRDDTNNGKSSQVLFRPLCS